MILIPVDQSYAFDYLAILDLKKLQNLTSHYVVNEFKSVLSLQLGESKICLILESKEYKDLHDANLKTFIAVDKAKINKCKAKEVQDANYERYLAKQALQNKFFPDTQLTEIKN